MKMIKRNKYNVFKLIKEKVQRNIMNGEEKNWRSLGRFFEIRSNKK